jgi:hypothetical protein
MNLETWLATATENLAPKAVTKVREDISMHVENAVNRYQLERHSELKALELAVKDLGDAKIAARGFENTHLTKKELEKFVTERQSASNQIWIGIMWSVFFIWSFWNNFSLYQDFNSLKVQMIQVSWSSTFFYFIISINYIFNYLIARKNSLKTYISSRIILFAISILTFIPISIWINLDVKSINQRIQKFNPSAIKHDDIGFFVVLICCFIVWGLYLLRNDYFKWRKLRFL